MLNDETFAGDVRVEWWIIVDGSDFIAILVYVDENKNGKWDPGEEGGFVGRCPYVFPVTKSPTITGKLVEPLDPEGPVELVRVKINVKDNGSGGEDDSTDDDRDNKLDETEYEYDHEKKKVKVTHRESDPDGSETTEEGLGEVDPQKNPKDLPFTE